MKLFATPILAVSVLGFASQTLACQFGATLNDFQYCAGNLKDGNKVVCRYNGYGDNTGYSFDCEGNRSLRCTNSLDKCTYKSSNGKFTFSPNEGIPVCTRGICVTPYSASPKCV